MVQSNFKPPKRHEVTPVKQALELVKDKRYAIFKDDRGVVYCEKVDHTTIVMSALGKTMGGQPNIYRNVVQWQTNRQGDFEREITELLERGFTLQPNMAYMERNLWGVRDVIKVIRDRHLGPKMSRIMRDASPEGLASAAHGVPYESIAVIPNARPLQPFTDLVLSKLNGRGDLTRQRVAQMYNGPTLNEDEQEWLDRWVAFG